VVLVFRHVLAARDSPRRKLPAQVDQRAVVAVAPDVMREVRRDGGLAGADEELGVLILERLRVGAAACSSCERSGESGGA
jgi:hypothetical protein